MGGFFVKNYSTANAKNNQICYNTGMEYIFSLMIGATIGSFLSATVGRLYHRKSFTWTRSVCDSCRQVLRWFELIPIVSFLLQGGRCRRCKARIPWGDYAFEVVMALVFVLIYIVLNYQGNTCTTLIFSGCISVVWYWFLASILAFIFVYDLKYYLILDVVTLPAIGIIFLIQTLTDIGPSWMSMGYGALIAGGFFLLQFIISKGRWIGGGDIRLGVLMGMILGWQSTLVALMLAYMSGALVGVGLLVLKKKSMQSEVPFGTFLTIGTLLALLWGEQLFVWYSKGIW